LPRPLDWEEESFQIEEAAKEVIVLSESIVRDGEARECSTTAMKVVETNHTPASTMTLFF
jgi:hypothetical protein